MSSRGLWARKIRGGFPEHARDYEWRFAMLPVASLRESNQYGEEPEGGWQAAFERHKASDLRAVKQGSPEYAGREEWLRDIWAPNTSVYPLFVVEEEGAFRLWDGHRRLAGAFFFKAQEVAALVGTAKPPPPQKSKSRAK